MKSAYHQLRPLGLLAEISIIYFLLPILAAAKLLPLSPMIMLVIVITYCLIRKLPSTKNNIVLDNFSEYIRASKRILAIIPIVVTFSVYLVGPEAIFDFESRKDLLLITLIIYPLLSVIPQEVIFRLFFFKRLETILSKKTLITTNALLFSLLHLAYSNIVALVLTFVAGLYFAITYDRHRSITIVIIEHSIFGLLLFALGVGEKYFFLKGFI